MTQQKLVPSLLYTAEGEESAKRTEQELARANPKDEEQAFSEALATAVCDGCRQPLEKCICPASK